jgi:hypothetical protein
MDRIALSTRIGCVLLCLMAAIAFAATPAGLRYSGRVLYRSTRAPVAGVLVELVETQDDGQPTSQVLGSTRADDRGRFAIVLTEPPDQNVALVVSAVQDSADTGGDRREEGYDIRMHRTQLGFLPHPSATKSNTLLITRRRPVLPANE